MESAKIVRTEHSHHELASERGTPVTKLSDPSWAWAPYEPDDERPWNLTRTGHLYRRAGFGANWSQLQQALSDGPRQTLNKLLTPREDAETFNRVHDEYEASTSSVGGLRAWWLRRMIETPYPLLEKMTLFWHSHLAANGARVKDARLMREYVRLLRNRALGSFERLLQEIWRNPAVLICLGAEANRKAQPNENLARALMANFTVGPGGFTEEDVREAARAFSGWFVLRGRLRYIEREHDGGVKRILGHEGRFTGEDVVRILLEQRLTASVVVRKLYGWLICESKEPNASLIGPLIESFAKDYDIKTLAETMLRSNLFFSKVAYRARIKCPVEYALGMVRGFEATVSTTQLAEDLADLGQDLYHPPTVSGWIGGRHWVNSATVIARHNLAAALLGGAGSYGKRIDPWTVATKHGCSTPKAAKRFLVNLLLEGNLDADVSESVPARALAERNTAGPDGQLRGLAQVIVTLPEFQLA